MGKRLINTLLVVVLVVFITIAIQMSCGCAYVQPVCETSEEVCRYAKQLCVMLNDTTYTRSQVDSMLQVYNRKAGVMHQEIMENLKDKQQ